MGIHCWGQILLGFKTLHKEWSLWLHINVNQGHGKIICQSGSCLESESSWADHGSSVPLDHADSNAWVCLWQHNASLISFFFFFFLLMTNMLLEISNCRSLNTFVCFSLNMWIMLSVMYRRSFSFTVLLQWELLEVLILLSCLSSISPCAYCPLLGSAGSYNEM